MTDEQRDYNAATMTKSDFDASNGKRRNFDSVAATWDTNPIRVKLAHDIVRSIRATIPLTPETDVLDFGCGTGLLSLGLLPVVQTVTGVDSSQGMLDVLDAKIRKQGFTTLKICRADPEHGEPLPGQYDLVVSSMAFHHIRDTGSLLEALYAVLKVGGMIAIADLDAENGLFHESPEGVFHNGFDRSVLRGRFERAGFTGVRNRTVAMVQKPDRNGEMRTFSVFLMTGHKPE